MTIREVRAALTALLKQAAPGVPVSKSDTGEMRVEQLPLAEIEENENNSYAQNDIDELAESIKVIGLQQPLVVRRKAEGGYLLLAGHRRRNALALRRSDR